MSLHSCLGPRFHFRIRRSRGALLAALVVLFGSSPALCDAIHEAARIGDIAKLKALLKQNPNLVFSKDKRGRTALHLAAEKGRLDMVELLIADKADVNAIANQSVVATGPGGRTQITVGYTPLLLATEKGHKGVVDLLLAKGATIDILTPSGETALHLAAQFDHKAVMKLLLVQGADINARTFWDGFTPLIVAAQNGSANVVQLLLEAGADKDAKDENTGYQVNARGEPWPTGQLNLATSLIYAASRGHADVVRYLLNAGADKEAKDYWGHTALAAAATEGYNDVVQLLMASGCDVNTKDSRGFTPLHLARVEGFDDVAALLRRHGGHE